MENIEIKTTPDTPYIPNVSFNKDTGVFSLSGESYMEDTYKFYIPIFEWVRTFIQEADKDVEFNIKLQYFNTSTSRCLLDIFEVLKEYEEQGKNVNINWYYEKEDPDVIDDVEDFEIESGIKINLIEIE